MITLKILCESLQDVNRLRDALRKNDINGPRKAITQMMRAKRTGFTPAQEMGMKDSEFRNLIKAIQDGDIDTAKGIVLGKQMPQRGPFPMDDDEPTVPDGSFVGDSFSPKGER